MNMSSDRLRFSTLKFFCIALTATLPVASIAHSDSILLLNNSATNYESKTTSKTDLAMIMDAKINEKGDLELQRGAFKVTMAYCAPGEIRDLREKLINAQRTDAPAISGVSVKLSLDF
jgi:hypothetical protein